MADIQIRGDVTPPGRRRSRARTASLSRVAAGLFVGVVASLGIAAPVPTTLQDFHQGGSQPNSLTVKLQSVEICAQCHSEYSVDHAPFDNWVGSMMAQSARDPMMHAARTIANQDAAFAGELCIRCHAPQGWMGGRSTTPDGSALTGTDFEGVSCSTCHRMVDPIYREGESPAIDEVILANLPEHPVLPGNASYVFDPLDRRRGPYQLDFDPHQWLQSPFHRTSEICATCHDVSNPAFDRQSDGSYSLNAVDAPHPTQNKHDMFPEQRTYSEWAMSSFATTPQPMGERYGSNQVNVQSCQDCHMPRRSGTGCDPAFGTPTRPDLVRHSFAGANTWVIQAVRALNSDDETHLSEATVDRAISLTQEMLRDASDVELAYIGSDLRVRVVNQTGHKLPTGYPEGRRVWVNVRFFDGSGALLEERGAYDGVSATLDASSTKVYECRRAITPDVASVFDKPAGEYMGLIPVNETVKDNRIPPRGFTNANFALINASPAGAVYADGQYWDDTHFAIPLGSKNGGRAEVRVFYQTTSREYAEFLRDHNTTDSTGQIAYDQWVLHGKSAPVEMDNAGILFCVADLDDGMGGGHRDQAVTIDDLLYFLSCFEQGAPCADVDDDAAEPQNPDGGVDINDLLYLLGHFEAGC